MRQSRHHDDVTTGVVCGAMFQIDALTFESSPKNRICVMTTALVSLNERIDVQRIMTELWNTPSARVCLHPLEIPGAVRAHIVIHADISCLVVDRLFQEVLEPWGTTSSDQLLVHIESGPNVNTLPSTSVLMGIGGRITGCDDDLRRRLLGVIVQVRSATRATEALAQGFKQYVTKGTIPLRLHGTQARTEARIRKWVERERTRRASVGAEKQAK